MAKSIELKINGETKTFYQPEHIDGWAALEGLEIGKEMQKKGEDNISKNDFLKIASFCVKYLYPDSVSPEEFIKGIDARKLFITLMGQLQSVLGEEESENFTKEKEA